MNDHTRLRDLKMERDRRHDMPAQREAIGRALVSAYPAGKYGEVPKDMQALLTRLDCDASDCFN
jgi:hypothetical protein